MFCTNCGGQLKILPEQVYNEITGLEDKYYGYCENCKIKIEVPETEIPVELTNSSLQKMEDVVLRGANKLDSLIEKAKEAGVQQKKEAGQWLEKQRELVGNRPLSKKDLTIPLQIQFGHKQLGIKANANMRQLEDGSVYFGYDRNRRYRLISYSWEGSEFQTVSNSSQSGQTKYREKNRQKGRGLATGMGALVGTAIMPGVGTLVGAAVGSSGPRKGKTRGKSVETISSSQTVEQIEKNTLAQLTIQDIETEVVYKLMFICNREVDGMLNCLNWDTSLNAENQKLNMESETTIQEDDYVEELVKLKKLLDSGIITQEEFEEKKKQLLGL